MKKIKMRHATGFIKKAREPVAVTHWVTVSLVHKRQRQRKPN